MKNYPEGLDEYEVEMLMKIDSDENLSESELSTLVWEFNEIELEYGENRRWSRSATSIIEIGGRFFQVDWENGLTESQPNEFYNQPIEVKKETYEKTITVIEWKKIK